MAANQTTNYQLNQWEPTDQVLRTDFNADNAKVDAALAGKVDQAALDNLESAVDTLTGTTASLSATHNGRVYTSSYTGNGSASKTISFPARPMLVNIMGMEHWLCAVQGARIGSGRYLNGGGGEAVTVSWSGRNMTVSSPSSDASYICNWSGERYTVMALLDANA